MSPAPTCSDPPTCIRVGSPAPDREAAGPEDDDDKTRTDADEPDHGTVDICITTMNRPDFCAKLLTQLGDEALAPYLDTVMVMEQGKDKVVDSEFFPEAEKSLGDRLRIIEQGYIGSGGFTG